MKVKVVRAEYYTVKGQGRFNPCEFPIRLQIASMQADRQTELPNGAASKNDLMPGTRPIDSCSLFLVHPERFQVLLDHVLLPRCDAEYGVHNVVNRLFQLIKVHFRHNLLIRI